MPHKTTPLIGLEENWPSIKQPIDQNYFQKDVTSKKVSNLNLPTLQLLHKYTLIYESYQYIGRKCYHIFSILKLA